MPALSRWRGFEQTLDRIVDRYWDEPVEIHPWTGGDYSGGGQPDTTRPVLKTRAVYESPTPRVLDMARAFGGGGGTQLLQQEVWISMQEDRLGDVRTYKKDDRVFLPERNMWFLINYVGPSATRRPTLSLSRLQDVSVA